MSRIIQFSLAFLILVSFSSCYPLQKLQEHTTKNLYPEGIEHGKLEKELFWFWNMEQSSSDNASTKTAAKEDISIEKPPASQSQAVQVSEEGDATIDDSGAEPVPERLAEEEPPSFTEPEESNNLRAFSSNSPIMFSVIVLILAILLGLGITFLLFRSKNKKYGINHFKDEVVDFWNSLFR